MNYAETCEYLFNQMPMFERQGTSGYKEGLTNTLALDEHLGHPHQSYATIHIGGTNGKGSCSHTIAAILQECGYKVGLYTSPHLVDFRERIRINGEMIPEQKVVDFVAGNRQLITDNALSFFEMTVGMAFDYFAKEQVDIAVIEVGMGGRLDSTNVITPLLSVITNIGLDHTQFLGDTLEKIAGEKAGIIKEGVPVVIGESQAETAPVFLRTAAERHAPISFADQHYVVDDIGRYTHELTGEYQKKNIATVLEAVEVLRKTNHLTLNPEHIQRGLAHVVTNTHLHGRWQKIGEAPLTICETAHNAPGVESMLRGVDNTPHSKLHVIYGCVNDKDFSAILLMLKAHFPADTRWYFTQPSVPRGLPVAQLQASATTIGIMGDAYERVGEAIKAARQTAQPDDLVLVTGSIFLVADALAFTNSGEAAV